VEEKEQLLPAVHHFLEILRTSAYRGMKSSKLPLTRSIRLPFGAKRRFLEPVNGIKTVFGVLFEMPGLFSILHTMEVSG
jgi:hypothetical protein